MRSATIFLAALFSLASCGGEAPPDDLGLDDDTPIEEQEIPRLEDEKADSYRPLKFGKEIFTRMNGGKHVYGLPASSSGGQKVLITARGLVRFGSKKGVYGNWVTALGFAPRISLWLRPAAQGQSYTLIKKRVASEWGPTGYRVQLPANLERSRSYVVVVLPHPDHLLTGEYAIRVDR